MGIEIASPESITEDRAGFPQLTWFEDRPDGKKAWVVCFITLGPNRELYFATTGSTIQGTVYKQRPWKNLVGFRMANAKELYLSQLDLTAREELKRMHWIYRLADAKNPTVMLADVADEYASIPMHLNMAMGAHFEFVQLHSALNKYFILNRQAVIDRKCDGDFYLPAREDANWLMTEERHLGFQAMTGEAMKPRGFLSRLFGG